jgi:DNA-binding transcriptional regulator LsrR (DeoR family)
VSNGKISKDLQIDYVRVANYYYKTGLTQEEIAKKMNMSRQRVNRILSKCIELGIVRISIGGVDDTYLELEAELEKKYGLKAVRISGNVLEENIYSEIGKVAAEYLAGIITNGHIIGFSRGRSLAGVVDNMPVIKNSNITVTQLMGGWNNQDTKISADDIVHRFSEKINATSSLLYAPVVVNSPELRNAIMKEPFFCEAYSVIKACSVAVVGIGDATDKEILPTMEDEDYEHFIDKKAVGEICTHFFDVNGRTIETTLDKRVIAVELEDFLKIPTRIGVAGSKSKIPAMLGALRGGYINSLITDFDTAQILCEEDI